MPDEDERPDQRKRNAARRTLARLHDEADRLRAEIAGLRLHLLAARQEVERQIALDPYFSATKIAWILDHVALK